MAAVLPQSLKPINSFLKLAKEYDKRDATISYFCRMYAVQRGIQLDSKSAESKSFLFGLMDQLENDKQALIASGDEAVSNDVVAEAHIETKTIDIFTAADSEDRSGIFDKKVTKAFYTASLLFEVLSQFGEQNDECKIMQKYSKWKATYLHRCSQTGETPTPGPTGSGFEEELEGLIGGMAAIIVPGTEEDSTDQSGVPELPDIPSFEHYDSPAAPYTPPPATPYHPQPPSAAPYNPPPPAPKDISMNLPINLPQSSVPTQQVSQLPDFGQLNVDQIQKLLKAAVSALEYEDTATAASTLTNAYRLLTNT